MAQPRKTAVIPAGALIQLSDDADALFRKLQRLEVRIRRLSRFQRAAKKIRKQLSAEFGAAGLGRTPQGRLIGRFHQSRQLPALPGKEISWDEFQELPGWDG